jgi:cytochrome b pre-mRNA-processing protein 3
MMLGRIFCGEPVPNSPENTPTPTVPMIFRLLRRNRQGHDTIRSLYGAIVAQARHPDFYGSYGVPDTVEGRFDMIVLHLVLLNRRLRGEARAVGSLGQGIFDLFCQDLDHNLREMGVGDLAVPKRMQDFGAAYYGRAQRYDAALDGQDVNALRQALARNVFGDDRAVPSGAVKLAAYVAEAERRLATQDTAHFLAGALDFPAPDPR